MKKYLSAYDRVRMASLFILSFIVMQNLLGQSYFKKQSNGNEFIYGNCVIQTPDKGICIVGSTNSFGAGDYDVQVIKLDSNAEMQWSRTFDWGKNEYGLSAVITKDKGIAITGYSNMSIFSDSLWDGFVLKLDIRGNLLWNRSIGGDKQDMGNCIIETSNCDLIVAGSTCSFGKGKNDVYLSKLTEKGSLIWSKTLGTDADDIAYSITRIKNGFAIAGATSNGFMPFVAKCDTNGNVIWSKIIAGSSSAYGVFNSIIKTADNGFALAGYTKTSNNGTDILVAKLTAKGNLSWCETIGNSGDDKGNALIEDNKGDLIITGYADYARNGYLQSLYMIKLSADNKLRWSKTITEGSEAIGSSITCWKEDRYLVTGSVWKTVDGYLYKPKIYLSQFDTSGIICGLSQPQNSIEIITPYIVDFTFDTSSGGYIRENIVSHYQGADLIENCNAYQPNTLASNATKFTVNSSTDNRKIIGMTIVPNPVNNGILGIRFNNTCPTSFLVSVLNMQGSNVRSFKLNAAIEFCTKAIDIATLPKGMYILKINDGVKQQALKFIKAN